MLNAFPPLIFRLVIGSWKWNQKTEKRLLSQPQMVVCISSKSYLSAYAMRREHLNASWTHIFNGLQYKMLLIYLDDIIIFASDFEEKMHRLRPVFDRICDAKLKLKPSKCIFFQREVSYLGHLVSEKRVSTDPAKIESIKEWPRPPNISEVRSLVGLCSYHRRFIKDFAVVADLCMNLQRKENSLHGLISVRKPFRN